MDIDLSELDLGSLEEIIGTDCYEAALAYVRRRAVTQRFWVAAQNALIGLVERKVAPWQAEIAGRNE